jgi:hypothetical protein
MATGHKGTDSLRVAEPSRAQRRLRHRPVMPLVARRDVRFCRRGVERRQGRSASWSPWNVSRLSCAAGTATWRSSGFRRGGSQASSFRETHCRFSPRTHRNVHGATQVQNPHEIAMVNAAIYLRRPLWSRDGWAPARPSSPSNSHKSSLGSESESSPQPRKLTLKSRSPVDEEHPTPLPGTRHLPNLSYTRQHRRRHRGSLPP